ncbi:MAG: single-stranded DNA-binding protein [Clostridiales bacterium]|nr:single-stranded DNA-binding protein [Clostridiales bacterium]
MSQDNLNNIVKISGEINNEVIFSHTVYRENFFEFKLKTKRLSDNFDILPIIVSEKFLVNNLYTQGAYIEVIGSLRSYNKFNKETNTTNLILNIFAKEINFKIDESYSSKKDANYIELIGFLCKTPIFRVTPFGREIADLLIAVNRAYNKSDYIPCIMWGKNAKISCDFKIGDKIKVIGRIQSRSYQKKISNKETIEKMAYEVSVYEIVKFL